MYSVVAWAMGGRARVPDWIFTSVENYPFVFFLSLSLPPPVQTARLTQPTSLQIFPIFIAQTQLSRIINMEESWRGDDARGCSKLVVKSLTVRLNGDFDDDGDDIIYPFDYVTTPLLWQSSSSCVNVVRRYIYLGVVSWRASSCSRKNKILILLLINKECNYLLM